MDKISGVLPHSKRLQIADKSDFKTNRNVPAGPESAPVKAIPSRVMPSSIESSVKAHREMNSWRTRDLAQARLVDNMAADFFIDNVKKPDEVVVTEIPAVEAAPQIDASNFGPTEEQSAQIIEEIGFEEQELPGARLYPKGSFVDYMA